MANYAAAALLTAQAQLAKKYTEAEMRRKLRPTIQLALQNQDYSIPDAVELKKAEQRPVEVHYLTRRAPGNTVVKATRHTGTKGDSAKFSLSWFRIAEKFSFSRKLAFNKLFSTQQLFNNEIEQCIRNIQDRLETATLADVVAHRCKLDAVNIATSNTGTWNDTNDALEIASADKDYWMQNVKTFMYGRYYRGELDILADLNLYPKLERVMNQGAGNQTNTGFQFGSENIMVTTEQILGAYTNGSALVMPKGTIAALPWNDPLNRKGYGSADSYIGMFTTMRDPFGLDLSYDVSVWSDRADTSAIDGHVQDINDEYEVSLMIGFAYPPLSVANDAAIHLVAQM